MNTQVHVGRRKALRFAAAFAVLVALPGCSDAAGLDKPAGLDVVSGDPQTLVVGARSQPLRVVVLDAEGQPMPGVVVFWSVAEGGGAVTAPTVFTDEFGAAEVIFTAGADAGAARVEAMVITLEPVEFNFSVEAVELK